ncbi:cell division protein SepF [Enterococcus faecalis]
MSFFNKSALSSFFGLSGEDDYDSYEEYEAQAVNEPARPAVRTQAQTTNSRVAAPAQAQTQTYTQSEPLTEKPSARYRSTEASQDTRATQQGAAFTEQKIVSMRSSNTTKRTTNESSSRSQAQTHKITVIEPRVYSEAMNIAKHIFSNEAVLVNFSLVEEAQARRIVDFLTGTVYALDGDIQRVGSEIFLCTPSNMEIDGAAAQSLVDKQLFDF